MGKEFGLGPADIRTLAPGFGGCIASDKITVQRERVGWMYREAPDYDGDSGWRFFSGTESDEYVDKTENFGVFDVNTIANYDPEIAAFLSSPVGATFARNPRSAPLRPAERPG